MTDRTTRLTRATSGTACAAAALGLLAFTAGTAQASAYDDAPPAYTHWIDTAEPDCAHPAVSPELIAAQLHFASDFDEHATSASGAQGPAQYLPHLWAEFGVDADNNGASSPYDIGDAVTALVREDCALAKELEEDGKPADTAAVAAAWFGGTQLSDDPRVRSEITPIIAQL